MTMALHLFLKENISMEIYPTERRFHKSPHSLRSDNKPPNPKEAVFASGSDRRRCKRAPVARYFSCYEQSTKFVFLLLFFDCLFTVFYFYLFLFIFIYFYLFLFIFIYFYLFLFIFIYFYLFLFIFIFVGFVYLSS